MSEIRSREARVELAQKQVDRVRDLGTTNAIASQVVDEAETDLIIEQIALEQANESRLLAQLDLERAERVLALRTIRSPVTGVVVRIYTSASESVEDRPIMQIAQIDPLYVQAIAPVEQFGSIEAGMLTKVFPEEPIGGEFEATVSLVERVIDASSGPVFISHDVSIGAGCVIQGPVYIGPGTRVNPRAWLHGANAIGPVCKVGGEIDGEHVFLVPKAKGFRHFLLVFEEELVIFTAADIVQPVANADQVILGLCQAVMLFPAQQARIPEGSKVFEAKNSMGCPDHGLDITEAAAALLDVRLQQVGMVPETGFTLAALCKDISKEILPPALNVGGFIHFCKISEQVC